MCEYAGSCQFCLYQVTEKKARATDGLVLSLFFLHFFMARPGESGYKSIHMGLPKEVSTSRLFLALIFELNLFIFRKTILWQGNAE